MSDIDDLVADLNERQRQAVLSNNPRILVIAGAGTGKTNVLSKRVARLLANGVAPDRILCVTFTNAAAAEMRERVEGLAMTVKPGLRHMPDVRTLHSWGARLIRRYPDRFGLTKDFTIYDEVDHEDVVRACAHDLGDKMWERSRLATLWRKPDIQQLYLQRLRESNAINFDQVEAYALELLRDHKPAQAEWTERYHHILVDEYQDTNLIQVALLDGLTPRNLFVVGDPRQSIYRFRGAEPATIVERAKDADYEVIELVENYRSVPRIIEYANGCVEGPWEPMTAVRARSTNACTGAAVTPQEGPLLVDMIRDVHRTEGRRWCDIAVLSRTWAALASAREHLEAAGIPIDYCGDEDDVWATEDGRNIARAIRLARNPDDDNLAHLLAEWGMMGERRFDDLQALRVVARQQRECLFDVMCEHSEEWAAIRNSPIGPDFDLMAVAGIFINELGIVDTYGERRLQTRLDSIAKACSELRGPNSDGQWSPRDFCEWWAGRSVQERLRRERDAVRMITVHGAKGLEWPVVVGINCRDGIFPSGRKKATAEDLAEDLRVFYVMVTRARDTLLLTCAESGSDPYTHKRVVYAPSPYLQRDGAPHVTHEPLPTWGGHLPDSWATS